MELIPWMEPRNANDNIGWESTTLKFDSKLQLQLNDPT